MGKTEGPYIHVPLELKVEPEGTLLSPSSFATRRKAVDRRAYRTFERAGRGETRSAKPRIMDSIRVRYETRLLNAGRRHRARPSGNRIRRRAPILLRN